MVEPLDPNSFNEWIYEEFKLPVSDIQEIDLAFNLYEHYLDLVNPEISQMRREYDEMNNSAIKYLVRKYSRCFPLDGKKAVGNYSSV